MIAGTDKPNVAVDCLHSLQAQNGRPTKGQALVEFTLIFMLLLVVAWIPADFGLAFYTSQLALNASREGARIGASDPNVAGQIGSCTLPTCSPYADGTALKETAKRVSSALMPGATIQLCWVDATGACAAAGASTCNQQLAVTVTGAYNYSFYRFLRFFGVNVPPTLQIVRSTQMRWEHQNPCT